MTGGDIDRRHRFAQDCARQAGAIARHYFRSGEALSSAEKGRHDPVTQADLEIDRFLIDQLAGAFPADGILTEETGGAPARHLWVIDPIDGTLNFARGIAHFAVSIAFCVDGQTESGVVYDPVSNEIFTARRGQGAFCNGRPIRVRAARGPSDAIVDAGYSLRHPAADYLGLIGNLLGQGYAFVQNGSAAMGLAAVACGRIDGFCELSLKSWDVLAGLLLVEEAGGWTSDFPHGPGLLEGHKVLACTPSIRQSLQDLMLAATTPRRKTLLSSHEIRRGTASARP
ncbi:inositol monophosphatase family protein [Labrys sp. (in: a-proteobacteria)]|uniref:inositol monophosphatase family protein n=1 Tax=Labrys sp. (in: a-proteobacteria) TaxID=1917972 RepID=UPI0039E6443F